MKQYQLDEIYEYFQEGLSRAIFFSDCYIKPKKIRTIIDGLNTTVCDVHTRLYFRDDCTCQVCGLKGDYFKILEGEHGISSLKLYSDDGILLLRYLVVPECQGGTREDLTNSILLCKHCFEKKLNVRNIKLWNR